MANDDARCALGEASCSDSASNEDRPVFPLITGSRPKFGLGREEVPGGGYYEGPFRFGKREGSGVLVADESGVERYEGQFKEEFMEGVGRKVWADGCVYEGQWGRSRKDGVGIFEESGGRRYDGEWRDGKRHGVGTQVFDANTRYQGRWENGLQHGTGKYFDARDGSTLEGHWMRGARHGVCVLRRQDGSKEKFTYSMGMLTNSEELPPPTTYPPIPGAAPVV
eukprot:TRINITY_DN40844_c0_g1_i1.p1 TRINITY_DN40844_c0_g1~~TRINITY_DN40844_c0_g1_i1.p1  ORF type:complete len:258 (-),score=40.13 TRINITY_DN40844_c0_g1_i1:203-871(-)